MGDQEADASGTGRRRNRRTTAARVLLAAGLIAAGGAAAPAQGAPALGGKCTAEESGSVQGATAKTTYVCGLVAAGRYQWVQVNPAKLRSSLGASPAGTATASSATTTAAATGAKTSKDKPGAMGTTYVLKDSDNGNIDVLLRSVDLHAWPKIKDENMFNDPPPPGSRYILVNLTTTFHAGKKQKALTGLLGAASFSVFGKSGVQGSTTDCSVVVPEQLDSFRELLDGASLTGNVCFRITDADAAGPLLFRADESLCFSNCDQIWVKLR